MTLVDLDDDFTDFAGEVALRFGTELITLDKEQLDRLPKVLPVRAPK